MLEHIPRLPKARPSRLPVFVFLVLLAVPIGLSALHGYDSARHGQQVALTGVDSPQAQLAREQSLDPRSSTTLASDRLPPNPSIDANESGALSYFRRWLNLPG